MFKYISKDVAKKAFKEGQKQKNLNQKKVVETSKARAKGEYKRKTMSEETVDTMLEAFAQKTGIDVERVQKLSDNTGREANGQFISSVFKMVLSASSENEYASLIHEASHATFAYNEKEMGTVKEAVLQYFIESKGFNSLEIALQDYRKNGYEALTRSELEEEFVSDALSGLFSTDEGVDNFIRWLENDSGYSEKAKKSILQKVHDWILEIIDYIKDIIEGGTLSVTAEEFAKTEKQKAEEIRQQFLKALESAGKNYKKIAADISDEETDIRYSLKQSLGVTSEPDTKSLLRQITELEQINEELRTKLRHPDQKHIISLAETQKVARGLKSEYKSKADIHKLTSDLHELYTLIANGEGLSFDVLDIHLDSIAEMILNESKFMHPDISEENRDILRDIRTVKIKLSEMQKAEVSSSFGSYNEFRKKTMGTLVLSKEGTDLDIRWQELCESYPQYFSRDIAEPDQPAALLEIANVLRNKYNDDFGFDLESAKDFLKAEIYEKYFEVPETKLLSEKYQAQLIRAKVEYNEKLQNVKAEYKKQNDEALAQARNEYGENLKNLRQEQAEEILKAKARMNQRILNIADTKAKEKERTKIVKQVKRLDKLLRSPKGAPAAGVNKEGKNYVHVTNIPEGFKNTVLSLCEMFTENTSVFDYKSLDKIKNGYAAIRANTSSEETSISGSYDFEIEKDLETLKNMISGKRLSQLTLNELGIIRNILEHFSAVIKNETELFVNGKNEKLASYGEKALSMFEDKGKKKNIKLPNGVKKAWNNITIKNVTPSYFFKKIGGPFEELYSEIRKGQDTYITNLVPAKTFFEETVKKFNAEKWLKDDKKKLSIKTALGENIEITVQQALLIYATAKREMSSGQNSKHLLSGGVVFENQIVKQKEGDKPWKYEETDKTAHPLSLEDILKIADWLTDEQKNFADTMVRYLSNDMAALGNEVSMQLYGIKKFNLKYYFPFNSDSNFGYRKFGEGGDSRLKAMSFTKDTVQGASNPLVLSDFTTVWSDHVERMCAYNAMVIPLEKFTRVWNFRKSTTTEKAGISVSAAFETAWGTEAADYVKTLMEDINGNILTDPREDSLNSLVSRFKKNAVFASLSVVVQQPSAIGRALALIDGKYFIKSTFSKGDYEELKKYAPVAVLKEIGGFDTTSGKAISEWLTELQPESFKEKFKEFISVKDSAYRDSVLSLGASFADQITWVQIWKAVKNEIRATTNLRGEEFLRASGKRFSEVVDMTQVYDSVLSRSELMRSKSVTAKMVTAFMAEPTLSYNLLMDAVEQGKKGNKKYFVRAISAFITSTLLNAMLKSIVTSMRDDDEDKSWLEKYIGDFFGNFIDDMNVLKLIPYVKDVWSICNGYDVSRTDMDLVEGVWSSVETMFDDDKTWKEKTESFAGALGAFLGLPVRNILRDCNAVLNAFNMVKDDMNASVGGIKYAVSTEYPKILNRLKLYQEPSKSQRLLDYYLAGDSVMYSRFAKKYKDGKAVKNALISEVKARYLENIFSKEKAQELLVKFGKSENEAYYTVRNWSVSVENSEEETENFESFLQLETIDENKQQEENVEDESVYADYSFLQAAVKSGNSEEFKREVEDLLSHGVEKEVIENKIKTLIRDNDETVIKEIANYKNGNLKSFSSTVKKIASKYSVKESTVAGAIRNGADVSYFSVEGTFFAMADVHQAIKNDKGAEAADIVEKITEAKIASGSDSKKANASIRSSLTSYWKEEYLKANSTERAKIIKNLHATKAYTNEQLSDVIARWRESE